MDLLIGLQWGDEGKGKIVDLLTANYKIVTRFQGGPNAGHTIIFDGQKHVLHNIPSGIFNPNTINVIGNGVVLDPVMFKKELDNLASQGIDFKNRLLISRKTHLILPTHRLLDAASEASKGKAKIGSTLKGIGPTYMDKAGRNGLRVGDLERDDFKERYKNLVSKHLSMIDFFNIDMQYDLEELEVSFFEAIAQLKQIPFIDSEVYLNNALENGDRILAEGAQGTLLDIDFGTYPFVTSSNTSAAGACIGTGVAPNKVNDVIGIFKAYTTRVGAGPFPTELFDEDGKTMSKVGNEFGSTTGRSRRCGWLDLVALKYAVQVNGVTKLMMMKGDVLSDFEKIKVCTSYKFKNEEIDYLPFSLDDGDLTPIYKDLSGWKTDVSEILDGAKLPEEFKSYVKFIENYVKVPITLVSVGPDREQTIDLV